MSWWRILWRSGVQSLLILAPLFTMGYSLLDLVGYGGAKPDDPIAFLFLNGAKQAVELKIRIALSAIAVAGSVVFDAFEIYIPRRSLLRFRKSYLDLEKAKWREMLGQNVRVNIMFARRRWYFLWLASSFEWTWNDGFSHPNGHRDANLWMCPFQGVCGRAFRTGRPQTVQLATTESMTFAEKWLFRNEYLLTGWQINRTSDVRAILSIPILEETEGLSPSLRSVGVINLDATTADGATLIGENEETLAEFFLRQGKILAALR